MKKYIHLWLSIIICPATTISIRAMESIKNQSSVLVMINEPHDSSSDVANFYQYAIINDSFRLVSTYFIHEYKKLESDEKIKSEYLQALKNYNPLAQDCFELFTFYKEYCPDILAQLENSLTEIAHNNNNSNSAINVSNYYRALLGLKLGIIYLLDQHKAKIGKKLLSQIAKQQHNIQAQKEAVRILTVRSSHEPDKKVEKL